MAGFAAKIHKPDQFLGAFWPAIRQRRIALGLKQKQLAFKANVSQCALSYAERDAHYSYGADALRKIDATPHRLEGRGEAAPAVDEAWP